MGMNTAVAEGHDLAWKLAWVLRGWAGPALLDSYEAEWRRIGSRRAARSADPGPEPPGAEALAEDLNGRLTHAWLPTGNGHPRSTLDLLGPGVTLLTGPDATPWTAATTALPRRRPRPRPVDRHHPGHRPRRRHPGPPRRPAPRPLANRPTDPAAELAAWAGARRWERQPVSS
jgi:hypothetical protein